MACCGLGAGTLLLLEATVNAEVFRYVDRDGKVHEVRVSDSSAGEAFKPRPLPAMPVTLQSPDFPFAEFVREAAKLYSLPPALILAVMKVESGFQPAAVSVSGAMGLMQLMPATAEELRVADPFDPRQNILGGARYLRILINGFDGDLILALAAYSAGAGAVRQYRGIPPFEETQTYVTSVIRHYDVYKMLIAGPDRVRSPEKNAAAPVSATAKAKK